MLDKFPKVRDEILEIIKNGTIEEHSTEVEKDMDADLSDDEFEEMLNQQINEAEEMESDFDQV